MTTSLPHTYTRGRALPAATPRSPADRKSTLQPLARRRLEPDETGWASRRSAALAEPRSIQAIPDLLNREPELSVDVPGLLAALDYAFAGGGCSDVLARALDRTLPAASTFEPESFSADLFLDELVATCMPVRIDGWRPALNRPFLVRVLAHPPADERCVSYRRHILRELSDDAELCQRFHDLYRSLCDLLVCFDHAATLTHYEATRRRIATLRAIRDVLQQMREGFDAAASGLGRIGELGHEMAGRVGYRRLVELLDLEGHLAQVDVRVQLGADGRVRRMELVRLAENRQNHFHVGPLRRWLTKLVLWWRGYRATEDELVERWLDEMFNGVAYVLPALVQLHGHMEVYLAALGFRRHCQENGLDVCFPEFVDEGGPQVVGLFNPLLFAQGIVPAPCDLRSGSFETTTIITGPNSGGKTRLLQAIGLLQVLGQSGFYVPAARARIRRVRGLFASLCEQPRVDQPEGHLGTELLRIRRLFETSPPGALVLLDELCSGTNPSEAEKIFTMVLDLLRSLRSEAYVTTHFLDLATRLADTPADGGLLFRRAELDGERRPTYRFAPGVADSSLASETAARLGVTREQLAALVEDETRWSSRRSSD